jgi:hypothetical protein
MRSMIRGVAVATLVAVPLTARSQATAAPRRERAPVWATLSAGRGDLRVNCGICRPDDQTSWAADASLGGWIGARTTLGGELGAWRLGGDEATQRVTMISAVSQLYPVSKIPAFVKLGVGMMSYRSTDGEQELWARSLALQAGFGVDIPIRHRYIVVPHATLVQGFNNGLYLDDDKVTGGSRVKLLRFGFGVGVGR